MISRDRAGHADTSGKGAPLPPRACVVGWPVEHSRSPMIHGFWLRQMGIAGSYEKVALPPEELESFLLDLPGRGFVGCNITVPHKEAAFKALMRAHSAGVGRMARLLSAVNTVWLDEHGRPCADNTDVEGFMTHFRQSVPGWRAAGRHVVVIGAGGAARAVVAGFAAAGVEKLTIANRTVEKARRLADDLSRSFAVPLGVVPLGDLGALLHEVDVLVNATSLGMRGQPPLEVALSALPAHAVVADIVYVPLRTPLLRQARARGLAVVDGLGMLLHQAVPGFARWFGRRPRVSDELRRLVEADIEKED